METEGYLCMLNAKGTHWELVIKNPGRKGKVTASGTASAGKRVVRLSSADVASFLGGYARYPTGEVRKLSFVASMWARHRASMDMEASKEMRQFVWHIALWFVSGGYRVADFREYYKENRQAIEWAQKLVIASIKSIEKEGVCPACRGRDYVKCRLCKGTRKVSIKSSEIYKILGLRKDQYSRRKEEITADIKRIRDHLKSLWREACEHIKCAVIDDGELYSRKGFEVDVDKERKVGETMKLQPSDRF